ncbi:diguanylate cyclase domain-containing protein [Oceanospirillum linum]|nr:diguanylate cyclase [Oceanospirillum linum]
MTMFNRLSLRQKLIAVPVIGCFIVVIFIFAMLGLVNRQEETMRQIVTEDLSSIARNTSLLSDLSRNHVSFQELLARYQQQKDSFSLRNIGLSRIHVIYQIRDNLQLEFQVQRSTEIPRLSEALNALIEDLEGYAVSAEATLEHAADNHPATPHMLLLLNRSFANTHRQFITFLELMGKSINDDTTAELQALEEEVIVFTMAMSLVLFMLLVFSFRQTGEFSSSLHRMIKALNTLASGERRIGLRNRHFETKELQQMSEAIDCFQRSLVALDITQNKVEETNKQLRQEITFKENAESELNNALDALQLANDELENRVAERTQELAEINDSLQQEVDFRREAEKQLQLFKMAVHNTSEAVIITDSDACILEVNPAYCQITGYKRQEVLGKNPNITRSDRHNSEFYRQMWEQLRQHGEWSGEIWDRRKSGDVFPKWLSINAVNDGTSDHTYYVGVFMDISRIKQAEQELERLAYYDPLTGLPNRVLFDDRLEQEIRTCSSDHSGFGLLYIDLDRFKYVNDTLGHSVGDELLVEVGQRIKSCIREPDTVARMSGDEFTVIVRSVREAGDMEVVAAKIIEQVELPVQIAEREVFVGASIGISLYPEHASDSEQLKKHADMAMYKAKESGRGRYQVFNTEMTAVNLDRMALTGQLKQAISHKEFILHYQPIVSIADSSVSAVEALIRWQPEEGKIIPPRRLY